MSATQPGTDEVQQHYANCACYQAGAAAERERIRAAIEGVHRPDIDDFRAILDAAAGGEGEG